MRWLPILFTVACGGVEGVTHHDLAVDDVAITLEGAVVGTDTEVHLIDRWGRRTSLIRGDDLVLTQAAPLRDDDPHAVVLEPDARRVHMLPVEFEATFTMRSGDGFAVTVDDRPTWAGIAGGQIVVALGGDTPRVQWLAQDGRVLDSALLRCDGDPVWTDAVTLDPDGVLWATTDAGLIQARPGGVACLGVAGGELLDARPMWGDPFLHVARRGKRTIRTRDDWGWDRFETREPLRDVSRLERTVATLTEGGDRVHVYDGSFGDLMCRMHLPGMYDRLAYQHGWMVAWNKDGLDVLRERPGITLLD